MNDKSSLGKAALIAGTIFIMAVIAPVAEIYIYPKLFDLENPAQPVHDVITNKALFVAMIFSYQLTFTGDIVVAWSLYILLAPVNKHLSLFAASFRPTFAFVALAALLQLITVFNY